MSDHELDRLPPETARFVIDCAAVKRVPFDNIIAAIHAGFGRQEIEEMSRTKIGTLFSADPVWRRT